MWNWLMVGKHTKMIHIAIVEDNPKELEIIKSYIQKFSKEEHVEIKISEFCDGIGIISPYQGGYEIIFLDIQMQFVDGLTTAKKIREKDEKVIIVFITHLEQYAIRGYSVGAMNFLIKPVSYFAFSEELKNCLKKINFSQVRNIMLQDKEGVMMVNINEIIYVESTGRILKMVTKLGNFELHYSLQFLEKQFNDSRFFRCHRGYLINMYFVERMKDNEIFIGETKIPLSRYKRKEFENELIHIFGKKY